MIRHGELINPAAGQLPRKATFHSGQNQIVVSSCRRIERGVVGNKETVSNTPLLLLGAHGPHQCCCRGGIPLRHHRCSGSVHRCSVLLAFLSQRKRCGGTNKQQKALKRRVRLDWMISLGRHYSSLMCYKYRNYKWIRLLYVSHSSGLEYWTSGGGILSPWTRLATHLIGVQPREGDVEEGG